ncbi:MAG: hypothetical protein Q8J62_05680, partial [Candidatus Cloacimonadaceae bacterium]|nr:hypothetical protein [Candidatus Cloacimonadaceae bacterium]
MEPYDFTIEEYGKWLDEEVPNRKRMPLLCDMHIRPGRKPKSAVIPVTIKEDDAEVVESEPDEQLQPDIHSTQIIPAASVQIIPKDLFIDFSPDDQIFTKYDGEAKLYGHLCNVILNRLADCESKVAEWDKIACDYNNGTLAPELYGLKGKRTERALRLWIERYQEAQQNMYALIHRSRNKEHKRKVTDQESALLLQVLLHPNQVTIGSAISALKSKERMGWIASPSSVPTLRRWCTEWAEDNPAVWNQTRKGSKFVAEHIIKTIIRDNVLDVGEVWVADGHTLAFDIYNPKTGKAQRMTM